MKSSTQIAQAITAGIPIKPEHREHIEASIVQAIENERNRTTSTMVRLWKALGEPKTNDAAMLRLAARQIRITSHPKEQL